jgi:opacity protein-like surface antigen
MLQTRNLAAVLMGVGLASVTAFAQEFNRSEVSVQAFGSFVKSTTDNGISQTATNSGGLLANYRFFFSQSHGIEVNYGYSLNTQTYGLGSGAEGVKSDNHEVSAAYVFRHKMRGFTPFAEAGASALVFDPRDMAGASTQTRAAFVYGAGADIDITSKFFVRAEYRGFVYDSPTYGLLAFNGADRVTHRAEPSVGFGYRF